MHITIRERRVINQTLRHIPAKQIAFTLGITTSAVYQARERFFARIGIRTTPELFGWYMWQLAEKHVDLKDVDAVLEALIFPEIKFLED